MNMYLN